MFNKIKLLANVFLTVGVVFGIITLFQISSLDLLNFRLHWIIFLTLLFLTILFIILGFSLKCIYKQLNDEIQSIYNYYDNKIKKIEEKYGIYDSRDMKIEYFESYASKDIVVELVKELHDRKGVTKKHLSENFGIENI